VRPTCTRSQPLAPEQLQSLRRRVRGALRAPYEAACGALAGAAGGKGRARKRAAPHEELLSWDWDGQREKLARALALIAGADLATLYRPARPDDRLLRAWAATVRARASSDPPAGGCGAMRAALKTACPCGLRWVSCFDTTWVACPCLRL